MNPSGTDMTCIPSIFIKTFHQSSFFKIAANLLGIIWYVCHKGHLFFIGHIIADQICSQKLWSNKKEPDFTKNQKVYMKIDEMADVFTNLANFAHHAFLTLASPSSYTWNLKRFIKVSKFSWLSQLLYKILRFSNEKNSFLWKKPFQKSPGSLGVWSRR